MHSPRVREGLTVFFTGLPGAGKSSIASLLSERLAVADERPVTLLDGDAVRKHISSDLGFSKEDRDLNIRRIAMIAAEITKYGGIAICSSIAPYDEARREARTLIEEAGAGFLLVYVATPVVVCEWRDCKGLYAKARAGTLHHFTGVSDAYEVPSDAELVIDTTFMTPEAAATSVMEHLQNEDRYAEMKKMAPQARFELATLRLTGAARDAAMDCDG